ncbi:MAG: hypothetical protein O7G83_20525, partial [Proteobacteria bacterium]|nr:hypothetical protein [Pseudomonadota bacterium]
VAEHKLYLSKSKPDGAATARPKLLTLPYRQIVKVGSSDCIDITLHKKSLRPVFRDAGYVDIEITYFNSDKTDPCSNPPPPAEPRP